MVPRLCGCPFSAIGHRDIGYYSGVQVRCKAIIFSLISKITSLAIACLMNLSDQIVGVLGKAGHLAPWLVVMLVFIGAMAFLVIPQLKRMSAHTEMLGKLAVGDRVVTNGGLVGVLTDVDGEILHISFSSLEPIPILRSAIERTYPA